VTTTDRRATSGNEWRYEIAGPAISSDAIVLATCERTPRGIEPAALRRLASILETKASRAHTSSPCGGRRSVPSGSSNLEHGRRLRELLQTSIPDVPLENKHIGFRVGDALAAQIDGASKGSTASRAGIVHESIRRGLQLLAGEAHPTISPTAAAAGGHQLRVSLTGEETAGLDALRAQIMDDAGRPSVRVFVLREALLRGLKQAARRSVAESTKGS
jgi:hypothetical protein